MNLYEYSRSAPLSMGDAYGQSVRGVVIRSLVRQVLLRGIPAAIRWYQRTHPRRTRRIRYGPTECTAPAKLRLKKRGTVEEYIRVKITFKKILKDEVYNLGVMYEQKTDYEVYVCSCHPWWEWMLRRTFTTGPESRVPWVNMTFVLYGTGHPTWDGVKNKVEMKTWFVHEMNNWGPRLCPPRRRSSSPIRITPPGWPIPGI